MQFIISIKELKTWQEKKLLNQKQMINPVTVFWVTR